ncbi:MAG: hypothetical protein ABJG94_10005 [Nitratireductor sp.]
MPRGAGTAGLRGEALDAVAAGLLGAIERDIGLAQHRGGPFKGDRQGEGALAGACGKATIRCGVSMAS